MRGQLFHGFGILFLGILLPLFLHLRTAASLLWGGGGSDIVRYVRVTLIDTTVTAFWAHASLVGIGLDVVLTLYNIVDIGGPSMIVL